MSTPICSTGDKTSLVVVLTLIDLRVPTQLKPIVLIPGGPGLAHDYLETIEALVYTDHRVIAFDPIGKCRIQAGYSGGCWFYCC